ncbi:hypothetical protein AVEN_201472-1 [Araneus ventricosus]|uniref:Uncharacterized protein n=1 Tax=Araneus ventricosus TaxID=182803 RepID=A0A4Y2GKA5_ARAVE|nr:hypothetical protein AVEN_201472-1 [Araneus ventricosus]
MFQLNSTNNCVIDKASFRLNNSFQLNSTEYVIDVLLFAQGLTRSQPINEQQRPDKAALSPGQLPSPRIARITAVIDKAAFAQDKCSLNHEQQRQLPLGQCSSNSTEQHHRYAATPPGYRST